MGPQGYLEYREFRQVFKRPDDQAVRGRNLEGGSMSGAVAGTAKEVLRQVNPVSASIGQSAPIGATVSNGGVNFSLHSRDAAKIELLLFDRDNDPVPARVITLD